MYAYMSKIAVQTYIFTQIEGNRYTVRAEKQLPTLLILPLLYHKRYQHKILFLYVEGAPRYVQPQSYIIHKCSVYVAEIVKIYIQYTYLQKFVVQTSIKVRI